MRTTPQADSGQTLARTRESVTDTLTNASIEADPARQCLRLTLRLPGAGTSFFTELSSSFALSLSDQLASSARGLLQPTQGGDAAALASAFATRFAVVRDLVDGFMAAAVPDEPRDAAPLGTATDGILALLHQAGDAAARGDRQTAAQGVMFAAGNVTTLHAFILRPHLDEQARSLRAQEESGVHDLAALPAISVFSRVNDRAFKIQNALWALADDLDAATFDRLFRGQVRSTADAPPSPTAGEGEGRS